MDKTLEEYLKHGDDTSKGGRLVMPLSEEEMASLKITHEALYGVKSKIPVAFRNVIEFNKSWKPTALLITATV